MHRLPDPLPAPAPAGHDREAFARLQESFETAGFAQASDVIPAVECAAIAERVALMDGTAGSRRLLQQDWCATLAQRVHRESPMAALIPADYVAVQCTFFEKSRERNWLVPVHQDLSIPVAERVTHATLSGWSEKEGGLFVQPQRSTLEQLVAVRLHLDPCTANDGPLQVVPGSHRLGCLSPEEAIEVRQASGFIDCPSGPGGVLAMRPLLLHASSKSRGTSRRRVLHFLFAPPTLDCGLRWSHAA